VDLVDDDGVDRAQRRARLRREQEVERLGCRDEDVGGLAAEARALARRRVARAHGDGGHLVVHPAERGHVRDARDRRAQVALDVDRERLER
jgi:hypothetical protein